MGDILAMKTCSYTTGSRARLGPPAREVLHCTGCAARTRVSVELTAHMLGAVLSASDVN